MMGVVGCSKSGGASSTGGTVKATCEDAGRRYGEFTAKMMIASPKIRVPADKRKLLADPIRDATVKSCQEDKWDDLPLSCLASVFDAGLKDDDSIDNGTDVCIKSVGKEKLDKMSQRVAQAMADAVGTASPSGSAAPASSGSTASDAPSAAVSGSPASSPAPTSTPASSPPPTKGPANKGGPASPAPKPTAPKPTAPKPPQGDDPF
jgi:hypothetical protein